MHKPTTRITNADDAWIGAVIRAIEQIALSSAANGHRVIGFTGVERHSGVSTIARCTAEVFENSGVKTLLVDLTQPVDRIAEGPAWLPGRDDPRQYISRRNDGADRLIARPTAGTHAVFNNIHSVRHSLAEELKDYSKIIVDIPPILEVTGHQINPAAAAAVCDAVLMVCVRGGVTFQQVTQAMAMIRSAGAKITGTVLNEIGYSTPGVGLARIARRVLPGRMGRWLQRKALESELLN